MLQVVILLRAGHVRGGRVLVICRDGDGGVAALGTAIWLASAGSSGSDLGWDKREIAGKEAERGIGNGE